MKTAWIFTGQGSQRPGMGADMYERFPEFAQVIEQAEAEFPGLKHLMFEDDGTALSATCHTQPALAAFAAGVVAVLRSSGLKPDAAAGLSLGEYSALYAAGVLDLNSLIRLTAFRGAAMQRAAEQSDGCMSAVIGLDAGTIREICAEVCASCGGVVSPANYNAPLQTVIAGERIAVELAEERLRDAGARRCARLRVSGAFHTELMRPAAWELHDYMKTVSFGKSLFPVFSNVTARPAETAEEIPDLLEQQVTAPVRMTEILHTLAAAGITREIEIGPGNAIAGFVRRTEREMKVCSIDSAEDLRNIVCAI